MKIILSLLIIGLIFMPGYAFAWKSLGYSSAEACNYGCDAPTSGIDHSSTMNFLILAAVSMIGLGAFYKYTQTGKYEVISLKCDDCGRRTNGLKCSICEERKQQVS